MKQLFTYVIAMVALCIIVPSCSVSRHIPNGRYMLDEAKVVCDNEKVMKTYALQDYVTQNTNTKWFGARVPLRLYCLSGRDTSKLANKLLQRLGEAPVLYDSVKTIRFCNDITQVLANAGYMKASVVEEKRIKGKKMKLNYVVNTGSPYIIRNVKREIEDNGLRSLLCGTDTSASLLKKNENLDAIILNSESNRITELLRNRGYYNFTKDKVSFVVDTAANSYDVDVTLVVAKHVANSDADPEDHKQYTIGNVSFVIDNPKENAADTSTLEGISFITPKHMPFRKKMLLSRSSVFSGDLYSDIRMKNTYNSINQLPAVATTSIMTRQREGKDVLDCNVMLTHSKPLSLEADIEATNSAGDLGAALSTTFQHNNMFKGGETFSFKIRGAYEAITGLEGYDGHNYVELGGEARLNFPSLILPFAKRSWGNEHNATSEVALQYNLQNRPEFQRRVLTAAWRYKWTTLNKQLAHKLDLMEVNYVYMPWISKTFKEMYLDSIGKTNAILKYNYENLLITKTGYSFSYNSLGARAHTFGKNAYTVRCNLEMSGLLLDGVTSLIGSKKNEEGSRTFCGIAYAQYVRGDIDYSKSFRINTNNSVAFHTAIGIAYPYGNSRQLPFEKRYFAGGANSVRGWSVRSLGPGSYNGQDKGINFLNQSGDIKLDLSMEYRAQLFWKLSGAVFIDGGNIWTIKKYEDQPGGEFRFDKFYEQIAASYGFGLRMDVNFFIVRFDAGMKAINPAYKGKNHYPILSPSFNRDFAFHFAVGMPF